MKNSSLPLLLLAGGAAAAVYFATSGKAKAADNGGNDGLPPPREPPATYLGFRKAADLFAAQYNAPNLRNVLRAMEPDLAPILDDTEGGVLDPEMKGRALAGTFAWLFGMIADRFGNTWQQILAPVYGEFDVGSPDVQMKVAQVLQAAQVAPTAPFDLSLEIFADWPDMDSDGWSYPETLRENVEEFFASIGVPNATPEQVTQALDELGF